MGITVDDMRAQVARIAELRSLENEINLTKKSLTAQLDEAEGRMLSMLEESQLKNFKSDVGLVSASYRKSVQTPKTPEDRSSFFEYLKVKGLFDQMITVHSATLNSFYKTEFDEAAARGDDDFKIPGISGETITPILSFRKA